MELPCCQKPIKLVLHCFSSRKQTCLWLVLAPLITLVRGTDGSWCTSPLLTNINGEGLRFWPKRLVCSKQCLNTPVGLVKRWRLKSLDSNGSFMRCLFTDISLMMRISLLCKMLVFSSKGITVTNGSLEWMATATCTVARFPNSFLILLAFVLLLLDILETQLMQFGTVLGCSP